jgi:hypothetical protein
MRVKEAAYDGEISSASAPLAGEPGPAPVMEFFADESCCGGNERNLIIGGIAVRLDQVLEIEERLRAVRANYPAHLANNEVKWSKCSKGVLQYYKDFADVFFGAAERDLVSFTSLWVNKSTFNHRTYNAGSPDIGFNKMVYQLLLHKVGKVWGDSYRITVKLDHRSTKHDPNDLSGMLNHDLRRKGIETFPFKRIEFRDSKKSELIQLNDLLIGALGCHHNPMEGRAVHKLELAKHILTQARQTCAPKTIYGWHATTFKVWEFRFKGVSSRA